MIAGDPPTRASFRSPTVHDIWSNSTNENGDIVPFSERQLRPIIYHLSPDYPSDLLDITDEIAEECDQTLKRIAAFRLQLSVVQIETDLLTQTGKSCLFCIARNEDSAARIGDLRHNFLFWVDGPQIVSPLGFGPLSANPETGRVVSATAYVYGASVDRYAQTAKDIIDLINGDRTEFDFIGGEFIREEIATRFQPSDPRNQAGITASAVAASTSQLLQSRAEASRCTAIRIGKCATRQRSPPNATDPRNRPRSNAFRSGNHPWSWP